jgi:hypothetical protein
MDEPIENNSPQKGDSKLRIFFLKFGGILAYVLHPCFLFFYFFVLLYFSSGIYPGYAQFWQNILIVLALTVLLPASFPFFYARDGFLKDRKKRPLTLFFTLICYIGCFIWLTFKIPVPDLNGNGWNVYGPGHNDISDLYSGVFIIHYMALFILFMLISGLILLFMVSFWFKISLHANGVGFILAMFIGPYLMSVIINLHNEAVYIINSVSILSMLKILVVLIFCFILLWQRVASGSHARKEVFWGLGTGFLIPICFMIYIGNNFDFATSVIPGWHTTIFPPQFHFPRFW